MAYKCKFSELQAWVFCAEEWDNAYPIVAEKIRYVTPFGTRDGICCLIDELTDSKMITRETRNAMMKKITQKVKKQRDDTNELYLFPLDKEGAANRAALCRKFAASLRKKKGVKK